MYEKDGEAGTQTQIIRRIPLEDVRELWYGGERKEPTPDGFPASVRIVCTSLAAVRQYLSHQTEAYWLLEDFDVKAPWSPADEAAATDGGFFWFSYQSLLRYLRDESSRGDFTLLVNPRRVPDQGRVQADATFVGSDFMRSISKEVFGKKTVVLMVGTEGGSLTLWGKRDSASASWEFSTETNDQSYEFLNDADRAGYEPAAPTPPRWTKDWDEAMAQFDVHQWVFLHPVEVHSVFRDRIKAAVEQRLSASGESAPWVRSTWEEKLGRLTVTAPLRVCLRDPIPEIAEAARQLNDAVSAHLAGKTPRAAELIRDANSTAVREWVESLWGANSPHVKVRVVERAPATVPVAQRERARMPTAAVMRALHERDGYHCRFCGIPVIRREVRMRIQKAYPKALPWGRKNSEQHAAFQAMWAQYDHLLPHTKGGRNDLENMVITCAPCNYARMEHTLEEVGLIDPRGRKAEGSSSWDGLERFR